jgi:nitric oxide synthase oxygenase domain/subunit
VKKEVKKNGEYKMKEKEMVFGEKLEWRKYVR